MQGTIEHVKKVLVYIPGNIKKSRKHNLKDNLRNLESTLQQYCTTL